jgi:hypothetical protein
MASWKTGLQLKSLNFQLELAIQKRFALTEHVAVSYAITLCTVWTQLTLISNLVSVVTLQLNVVLVIVHRIVLPKQNAANTEHLANRIVLLGFAAPNSGN